MNPIADRKLKPEQLTWRLPEEFRNLHIETIAPADKTVGQPRALTALEMGLEMRSPGFNIYVAGANGTGRTNTVMTQLERMKQRYHPTLRDRAYVHNFSDPASPKLLEFPAGQAREFRKDLQRAIQHLRDHIPSILEEETFRNEKDRIQSEAVAKEREMIGGLEGKLRDHGLVLIQLRAGNISVPEVVPIIKGRPIDWEEAEKLVGQGKLKQESFDQLKQDSGQLREEMEGVFKQLRALALEVQEKVRRLEIRGAEQLAKALLDEIRERYKIEKVQQYLVDLLADVLENIDMFKKPAARKSEGTPDLSALLGHGGGESESDGFSRYDINILLDHHGRTDPPVVIEDSPTYSNLLGTVEIEVMQRGTPKTDFMRIKGGSMLRADGGFLVLQALDLLVSPGAWSVLKRVLKTGRLEIRPSEFLSLWGTVALKPEPIEIDIKVILIGEPYLYTLLYIYEDDFKTIFKVKAEFDSEMSLRQETLEHFMSVVNRIREEEKILPLHADAAVVMIQEAVRVAGRRNKITTRFSEVGDVVREAHYWAQQDHAAQISAEHVRRSIRERDRRNDLIDEKIGEYMKEGVIHIETTGARVGQINGLAVYDTGMYAFGKPTRITATVSLGRAGIVSVEREAGLSGHIHDKGMLILTGFLRHRYAQNFPLSLSASIAFEQSYGGVEGDSASSTEVYVLLSALSGVPIRQSVAVTGSVDQYGRIQAIGGVNEKIEGFFRYCREQGLTGDQGVMVPATNRNDLILRDEVIDAVRAGTFHIWAIETVDEGLEILTGIPAGERAADGGYPEGTINAKVSARLKAFADTLTGFDRGTTNELVIRPEKVPPQPGGPPSPPK